MVSLPEAIVCSYQRTSSLKIDFTNLQKVRTEASDQCRRTFFCDATLTSSGMCIYMYIDIYICIYIYIYIYINMYIRHIGIICRVSMGFLGPPIYRHPWLSRQVAVWGRSHSQVRGRGRCSPQSSWTRWETSASWMDGEWLVNGG